MSWDDEYAPRLKYARDRMDLETERFFIGVRNALKLSLLFWVPLGIYVFWRWTR